MRKTSQDGGDSTSITSGIENEIKKPGAIIKTKRNSIKRKVQNFSHESDDAVVEPLLQKDKEKKDKEKTDISNQSAKYNLLSKTKTDSNSERGGDKDKLLTDDKLQKTALCHASDDSDRVSSTYSMKDNSMPKFTNVTAPMHNHMNTNVFSSPDALKSFVTPKSQILVEIDGSKQSGYSPSPLIFTTAKIHTDGKTQNMEPLQVTPVPILSTIEVSVLNAGKNKGETSAVVNSSISTMYTNIPKSNIKTMEKEQKQPLKTVSNTPTNKIVDTKIVTSPDKTTVSIITTADNSSKDSKTPYSTFSPNNIKDTVVEYKSISIDSKKDQDGYATKMPTSQPIVLPTSVKTKTITPSETVKTGKVTTPITSIKSYTKDSGGPDQGVVISKDQTDGLKYPEKKNDLNKNVMPESLDSQRSKASDNVYSCDQTTKGKTVANGTSFNSRQLQRQSIVTEKDDHISKSKSGNGSYSSINDSKSLKKSSEHASSPIIEGNNLNEKTKLPKPNASSVPITCAAMTTANIVTTNKTAASITTVAASTKISAPIVTTASVNKTSASVTTAVAPSKMSASIINTASINKTSTSITTAAHQKMSAPIITTAGTNKTSIPITTVTSINKSSAPMITTGTINKTSASTNSTVVKTSAPVTNTAAINKTIASTITTAVINKTSAAVSTTISATINKAPTSITTTVSGNKLSDSISSAAASNKTSIPITNTASVNKSSAPVITTTVINKKSAPVITTAVASKTPVPITASVAANKSSISSIKPSTTSSNTPIPKQGITTTSSISQPSSSDKYSVGKATISGNSVQSKPTSSSSTNKSQVTGIVNPKPAGLTISAKSTKSSMVVTPTTSSQPSTEVTSSTVAAAKSGSANKISTVENQGKSTENTTKSLTSNVKPSASTAKGNSTIKSSPANVTHGVSNVTSTATTSNSVSSNKQSESKTNELSNGDKSLKA